MKKRLMLCVMLICIFIMPLNCMAMEVSASVAEQFDEQVLLGSGYTEDGVYYEVYGSKPVTNVNRRVSIEVERTVVYEGRVFPSETLYWQEDIGGLEYRGTLYLDSFYYTASTNKTTAFYVGTISN